MQVDNLKIGSKTPWQIRRGGVSPYEFRLSWDIFVPQQGVEVNITDGGQTLEILKFRANKYSLLTNFETSTNTYVGEFFKNWYFKVENLYRLYDDKILANYHSYPPVGDGRSNYNVRGLMVSPTMSGNEYFYRFPWDMGIPVGGYKDGPNNYALNFGWLDDGVKERWTHESFSDGWGDNNNCQFGIGLYGEPEEGTYDENQIIDISDKPLRISLMPVNEGAIDIFGDIVDEVRMGSEVVYKPENTVDNLIIKPFLEKGEAAQEGYAGVLDILEKFPLIFINYKDDYVKDFTGERIIWKLPDPDILTDLDNYYPQRLRFYGNFDLDKYIPWINRKLHLKRIVCTDPDCNEMYQELTEENYYETRNWMSNGSLCGLKINNTEDNPVVLTVDLVTADNEPIYYKFVSLDFLCKADRIIENLPSVQTNINYLKIVLKNCAVSTCFETFAKFTGNLEIIALDENGEQIPHSINYGFSPTQMDSTFSASGIQVLKRENICWSRVSHIRYAFENCGDLTEVQANEGEMVTFKMSLNPYSVSETFNKYSWPIDTNSGTGIWQAVCKNIFSNDQKLIRVEPIFNVRYIPIASCMNPGIHLNNLEYLRIKGINNFNWDFTLGKGWYMPKLNAECIQYLFDNAEDLVSIPFNEAYLNPKKFDGSDEEFDMVNIRTRSSLNGLTVTCPPEWSDKITEEMKQQMLAKGWTVIIQS